MEVRANDGKGSLLFEWDSEAQTIDIVRKDMFYKVYLDNKSYCIKEEHSKYDCKKQKSCNTSK